MTNSFLMPIVAAVTCVFVGWVVGTKAIEDEVARGQDGGFAGAGFYRAMVRYIAPTLITAILVSEVCRAFGIGGWKI